MDLVHRDNLNRWCFFHWHMTQRSQIHGSSVFRQIQCRFPRQSMTAPSSVNDRTLQRVSVQATPYRIILSDSCPSQSNLRAKFIGTIQQDKLVFELQYSLKSIFFLSSLWDPRDKNRLDSTWGDHKMIHKIESDFVFNLSAMLMCPQLQRCSLLCLFIHRIVKLKCFCSEPRNCTNTFRADRRFNLKVHWFSQHSLIRKMNTSKFFQLYKQAWSVAQFPRRTNWMEN